MPQQQQSVAGESTLQATSYGQVIEYIQGEIGNDTLGLYRHPFH